MRKAIDESRASETRRAALIDAVLAEPWSGTAEDIEFCEQKLDTSKQQLRTIFIEAPKLLIVEHPSRSDTPLYIVAVDDHGYIHTLGHADMPANRKYLTRALLRFVRSDEGHTFAQCTMGWADVNDISAGYFSVEWARALGFAPVDQHQLEPGLKFQRFQYRGAAAYD